MMMIIIIIIIIVRQLETLTNPYAAGGFPCRSLLFYYHYGKAALYSKKTK